MEPSPERNGHDARVLLVEVERVITSQGAFSIYQFNARSIEDIEDRVAEQRSIGIFFGTPESFRSPIAKPFFKHVPVEYKDSELPTIVYLVGPPLSNPE